MKTVFNFIFLCKQAIIDSKEFTDELITGWDKILPDSFLYNHVNREKQIEITKQINEFYFGNITVSDRMREPKDLIDVSLLL